MKNKTLKLLKEYKEKFNNMEKNYKKIIKILNELEVEYEVNFVESEGYYVIIIHLGMIIEDYGTGEIYIYYDFNDEEETLTNINDLKRKIKILKKNLI